MYIIMLKIDFFRFRKTIYQKAAEAMAVHPGAVYSTIHKNTPMIFKLFFVPFAWLLFRTATEGWEFWNVKRNITANWIFSLLGRKPISLLALVRMITDDLVGLIWSICRFCCTVFVLSNLSQCTCDIEVFRCLSLKIHFRTTKSCRCPYQYVEYTPIFCVTGLLPEMTKYTWWN